jgi:hypothetical protein
MCALAADQYRRDRLTETYLHLLQAAHMRGVRALTTVLTTATSDGLRLWAILKLLPCQVSHAIPQTVWIWHARGPGFESP